ncbi:MAG: hypothetical protein PHT02_00080 [Tissierellia bacterium]|nr:hypothetical protein [Tissierellia bacterium]
MNYENVTLWFAKDNNDKIITIDEINDNNKNDTYLCPMCGSNLIPKATKSKKVSSHFAHIDASKCNSETMIHWWFKNKFLIEGDKFVVKSDLEREYVCKEVLIEQSINVRDKVYRPDVIILTECGKTIYFEMDYTNKKKLEDYIDMWLELKNIVVEVDIKQLMLKNRVPVFKALFYNSKCFINKEDINYYNRVNKYKNEFETKDNYEFYKSDLEKLNWIWTDIKKYKNSEINIYELIELIQEIETNECRKILLDLLKKLKCNNIIDDYINDLKNKIYKIIKSCSIKYNIDGVILDYSINIPKSAYDKIFNGFILKIKNKEYFVKNINEIQSYFYDKCNVESSKILLNKKFLDINEEYDYKKLCPDIDCKSHQVEVSVEGETIEGIYIKVKHLGGEFNINDNIHEIIRSHTFLTKNEAILFNKITKEIKLELSDYLNNWEIYSTISAFNDYSIELRAKVHNEIKKYCGNVYCHISLYNSKYGTNKGLNINYRNCEYIYVNDDSLKELKSIILNQFKWIMERKIPIAEHIFTKYLLPYDISFISKTVNPNIKMKIKSSDTVLINIKNSKKESIELLLRNNTLYADYSKIEFRTWKVLEKYLLDINEVINIGQSKEINELIYNLNKNYSSLKIPDYISKKYYDAKYSVISYIKDNTSIIELILCDYYGSPIGNGTIDKFYIESVYNTNLIESDIRKSFSNAVRNMVYNNGGQNY